MKNNKKVIAYKAAIAVLFGLLSFVLNFHSIHLLFPPYKPSILLGLLFPLLITLAWGWKYGLLSALAGGCQSMWWIWGPSNGYAVFFVVPPFTLWIVWHGLCAGLRGRKKEHKWWLSIFAVEIPFRILSTINLYTLSRWAITLNPPPWRWASDSANEISLRFSTFVVIKQAVVGCILLLMANVMLNLGFIRKFLRLKEQPNQWNTSRVINASLLFGVLFWIIDSIVCMSIFRDESPFFELLMLNIPAYNLYVRFTFILACLAAGVMISNYLRIQHKDKEMLRQSGRTLSQIIQGNSIATFVINNKHVITHWNKAGENLTGISSREMIGTKNQWMVFYSAQRPVMADLLVDGASEKEIIGYCKGKYRKSILVEGAYEAEDFFPDLGKGGKWLFFAGAPLKNMEGEIVGAIETLQDITERKKAEAAILESKIKLQVLYDSSSDAIMLLDEKGFFDCNNATLRLFGCTDKEEFCGRHPADFSPPTQPDGADSMIYARHNIAFALKEGSARFEHLHRRLDNTDFFAQVLLDKMVLHGKEVLQARVFDITERKKVEEELESYRGHLEKLVDAKTGELKAVNKELEAFSFSVAHDLRAPLRSMDGFSELVLKKYADKLDPQGKDYLERIKKAATNMTELIEAMLYLAHVTRKEIEKEQINLSRLAEEIVVELQQREPERQMEVNIRPRLIAVGDRKLLRVVLWNLLENAWKFSKKNLVARIEFGEKQAEDERRYFVCDNGVGFDVKYKDKLFSAFQRLHSESEFSGTGVGLATVQRIIRKHGGRVWAESEPGKGATFYFTLAKL